MVLGVSGIIQVLANGVGPQGCAACVRMWNTPGACGVEKRLLTLVLAQEDQWTAAGYKQRMAAKAAHPRRDMGMARMLLLGQREGSGAQYCHL